MNDGKFRMSNDKHDIVKITNKFNENFSHNRTTESISGKICKLDKEDKK